MKIRLKLALSLIFLFVIILCLGGVGSYYLQWLAKDSRAIIKDNYRSLVYMQNLDKALDQLLNILPTMVSGEETLYDLDSAQQLFTQNMRLQLQNLTEPGEQQLSETLDNGYGKLKEQMSVYLEEPELDFYVSQLIPGIVALKEQIDAIYVLNEATLLQKNEQANQTAEKVVLYMAIFGSSAVVIGFLFMVGIPVYISRPISRFNDAILEIARGNYKVQLPVKAKDEFGQLAKSFNTMAAKLEEYEHSQYARILYEKKRIDAIANQMQDAIIGLDENKMILFINQRALKLLGLNKAQIMGKYAPDIAVTNRLMQHLIAELMIGFEDWEEKKYRSVKIVEDNRQKLFSKNIIDITGKPTGESREVLIGHVIILTDVTDFAEKDLAKTHFMATLSHELKTPSAAIEMSANLLKNDKVGSLNTEQETLIHTIKENNDRIQRIIREILDLSKIENGFIDIVKAEASPDQLIRMALQGVRLFLEEKALTIQERYPQQLPAISVDPHKTVWVLNNFLTNAIRYSPQQGHIIVHAEATESHVLISVIDHGPGISRENQKRIFKKFSRIAEDQTKGTGLGLAISKEFIEAMGGSIGVKSEEGKGATFWIKFPVHKQ